MLKKFLSAVGLAQPNKAPVATAPKITASPLVPVTGLKEVGPYIAIVNRSTVLSDADLASIVPALQTQLDRDFSPVWGIGANLSFVGKNSQPGPGMWQVLVVDDSDQAGALGYHDLTDEGLPLSHVFARTDIQNHLSWSVTVSHELLEMLVDPDINLTAFVQMSDTVGVLYAYEVCDACEDDIFAYPINGVKVSDFVYPTWFESFRKSNSTKFNYTGKITAPFQLLSGGYIGVFQVGSSQTGWTQLTAQEKPGRRLAAKMQKGPYSRTNRRKMPHNHTGDTK
jgi:hypothetical protein